MPVPQKPKTARHQLSNVEKGMILAFFWVYQQISIVSTLVNRPWSTVRNFLARACERGHIENLLRSGRPKKLNCRTRRAIVRAALANRDITRLELQNCYAPEVSVRTVDRVLREANVRKWIAKRRPRLTAAHARKRLNWAMDHKDWTAEDFQGVLYSDECIVRKSACSGRQWVFRTPQEKWLAECIRPVGKRNETGLMVWSCFWGKKAGPLVTLRGSVDRHVYLSLLEEHLPERMQEIADEIGDPLFQQDNAPIHKAGVVMEWLSETGYDLEDHPPLSPDLNPIEWQAWVELKKRLHQQYPDIVSLRGTPERIRDRLEEVLPLVWATIPEEFFESLWKSMPARVAAVIEAKGWYTKY